MKIVMAIVMIKDKERREWKIKIVWIKLNPIVWIKINQANE